MGLESANSNVTKNSKIECVSQAVFSIYENFTLNYERLTAAYSNSVSS